MAHLHQIRRVTSPVASVEAVSRAFQAVLDRLAREHAFPGATAAFALADGTTVGFATGLADVELGTPMTPESRMLAGSIGKTIVATVALGMIHEGKLGLHDPIARWLGDETWFPRLPNGDDITVRMLLTHSSGIPDHVYTTGYVERITHTLRSEPVDRDFAFTPRESISYILDGAPLFPAGEGYTYTDTAYILTGLILERAGDGDFFAEARRRVLDPFGLRRTAPSNHRDLDGLAPGYLPAENPFGLPRKTAEGGVMQFNPASEWTGGGFISNPQDLVRWAQILFEGRALPQPYLDLLLDGVSRGDERNGRYGLGCSIDTTPYGPEYGHGGWFPGWRSRVSYWPQYGAAIAIQVNSDLAMQTRQYIHALAPAILGEAEATPCAGAAER